MKVQALILSGAFMVLLAACADTRLPGKSVLGVKTGLWELVIVVDIQNPTLTREILKGLSPADREAIEKLRGSTKNGPTPPKTHLVCVTDRDLGQALFTAMQPPATGCTNSFAKSTSTRQEMTRACQRGEFEFRHLWTVDAVNEQTAKAHVLSLNGGNNTTVDINGKWIGALCPGTGEWTN